MGRDAQCHRLLVEVSSDYSGGGEFFLHAVARNADGNLDAFDLSHGVFNKDIFCEGHRIDIAAKDVVAVGRNQIEHAFRVVVPIGYVFAGGGYHRALVGGRSRVNRSCGAKLTRYPKEGLSRAVDCFEDVFILPVIYDRGVEGEGDGGEQYGRDRQSEKQLDESETGSMSRISYIAYRISYFLCRLSHVVFRNRRFGCGTGFQPVRTRPRRPAPLCLILLQ